MKRLKSSTVLSAAGVLFLAASAIPAQETKPAPGDPNAPTVLNDLTTRFRLHEQYSVGKAAKGEITEYRVGFKETFRRGDERPQGTPERTEFSRRVIYDERPALVSTLDARRVTDVVRRYTKVVVTPEIPAKTGELKPFDNLTIWLRTLPGEASEIVVLTPNRPLLDREYMVAAEQIFVPDLAYLLPELPVRIGETWTVARTGASTLVGLPVLQGTLTAKLLSVQVDPVVGTRTAVIDVQGRLTAETGEGPVHAELEFVFNPPPSSPKGAADAPAKDVKRAAVVDAVGWISRISLAQEFTGGQARDDDRLKSTTARELILERRLRNAATQPLAVPAQAPTATIENSWLTYVDPQNRFHFRHPQNLKLQKPPPGASVFLVHPRRGGADYLTMSLVPRAELTPEKFQETVTAELNEKGVDLIPGQSEWLPEAEWPKMKVHRAAVAMMPKGRSAVGSPRLHEFDYIVQTGREEGLQVRATTNEDPPTGFRQEVESMLKTFQFDAPTVSKPVIR